MRIVLAAALTLSGLAVALVGVGMIYQPAAVILGGAGLALGGLFLVGGIET